LKKQAIISKIYPECAQKHVARSLSNWEVSVDMKVYSTDKIRNVVLLGHGGAGKTTLAEAMAYLSGITNRLGKVTDGNTVSDYDKEEIKRKFSISTAMLPIEWNDVKVNILIHRDFSISSVRQKKLRLLQMLLSSLSPVRAA